MGLKMTYRGPDFRGQVAARKLKAALDAALQHHRRRFLPKHFREEARNRYPQAYQNSERSRRSQHQAQKIREKLSRMSPAERREWYANRRRRNDERRRKLPSAKRIDRNNRLPLVLTGRSRNAILHGHVQFQGPVNRRKMQFNPPYYFFIKSKAPEGKLFDKVRAVQVVRPDEEQDFARVVEREVQQYLNEQTHTRRSR